MRRSALTERFWAKVNVRGPNECWEWQAARNGVGRYGVLKVGKKMVLAHRISYELANGPIPGGLLCCHHCDNPPCCNPQHLYVGTAQQNTDDMFARGRAAVGEKDYHAKLTEAEVLAIRQVHAKGGVTQASLADKYGVHNMTVSRIVNGRIWKHLLAGAKQLRQSAEGR